MNDPQQIRRAMSEIRRALDSYPREGLAEILALVFKEYVIEGQQVLASGTNVLDARSDLEGMSFPELVLWLQTHLDLPELALFEVASGEVSVRADGRSLRLQARAPQPAAPPPPVAVAPPAPSPAPARPAPPPEARVASTVLPAQPPPPVPGPASTAPASPAKEESSAETGTRFSLLEVD